MQLCTAAVCIFPNFPRTHLTFFVEASICASVASSTRTLLSLYVLGELLCFQPALRFATYRLLLRPALACSTIAYVTYYAAETGGTHSNMGRRT